MEVTGVAGVTPSFRFTVACWQVSLERFLSSLGLCRQQYRVEVHHSCVLGGLWLRKFLVGQSRAHFCCLTNNRSRRTSFQVARAFVGTTLGQFVLLSCLATFQTSLVYCRPLMASQRAVLLLLRDSVQLSCFSLLHRRELLCGFGLRPMPLGLARDDPLAGAPALDAYPKTKVSEPHLQWRKAQTGPFWVSRNFFLCCPKMSNHGAWWWQARLCLGFRTLRIGQSDSLPPLPRCSSKFLPETRHVLMTFKCAFDSCHLVLNSSASADEEDGETIISERHPLWA